MAALVSSSPNLYMLNHILASGCCYRERATPKTLVVTWICQNYVYYARELCGKYQILSD